jgi:hypothetical protein
LPALRIDQPKQGWHEYEPALAHIRSLNAAGGHFLIEFCATDAGSLTRLFYRAGQALRKWNGNHRSRCSYYSSADMPAVSCERDLFYQRGIALILNYKTQ